MDRLFVYGSLKPGGPNEQLLAAIEGDWEPAVIQGRLVEAGWGASLGYPALVLEEGGNEVHGFVFTSAALAARWAELDEFEGEDYERIVAPVTLRSGKRVKAHVYVFRAR